MLIPLSVFAKEHKVRILLFYSPHCGHCIRLEKEFLPKVIDKYKNKINLEFLSVENKRNLSLLISLTQRYHMKRPGVPSVLIGNDFITGTKVIEKSLDQLIYKYSHKQSVLPYLFSGVDLVREFKSLPVLAIIGAGLIDGINPCAFAVIIFFISFLSVYGYNRREIVYIGCSYILSVFITYILIGVGLFSFFYSLRNFYFLMKFFYYSIASFCFILAGFSLYDYFRYKRTKQSDGFILQLPMFFKKRINLIIGAGLRKRNYRRIIELCAISFLIGFGVSLLEAVCTGQVYVPTIAFIFKVRSLRLKAAVYLILYNIMFILPLVAIFVLSLLGIRSQQFNRFLKNNLGRVKAAMACFFLILGVFILWLS